MALQLPTPKILNKLCLSFISLLFGYGIWQSVGNHQKITIILPAAVSFYNGENLIITPSLETIDITLYGTRSNLKRCLYQSAIHIDAALYKIGHHTISIEPKMIYVPDEIMLLNYHPQRISFEIK